MTSIHRHLAVLAASVTLVVSAVHADDFKDLISPILQSKCVECHGKKRTKGKVDLYAIKTQEDFYAQPELIGKVIDVVDALDMPPEDEPELTDQQRTQLLDALRKSLKSAAKESETVRIPIHRLNRFQYNNAVRDLFDLSLDPFALPERLMTRHTNYLNPVADRLPEEVKVSCDSLNEGGGMRFVDPFPKDLQAEHGYDNQADHLTLPPLLIEAMFDLGVSILKSPDFNPKTVGIWDWYFAAPNKDKDLNGEIQKRMKRFVRLAFRGPVEERVTQRYVAYVVSQVEKGSDFTSAMKDAAAAVLSSPKFLYRFREAAADPAYATYALASKLSFFLWGSSPDETLLDLADSGKLSKPDTLKSTVRNMMKDPKIVRFLDSFPAQWMQLEMILSATPDRGKYRYYSLGKQPAGIGMVPEPLLLFDAIFLENRPLEDLINPTFSYHNSLLEDWYGTDLNPPKIDAAQVQQANEKLAEKSCQLIATMTELSHQISNLAKDGLVSGKKVTPVAAWNFNGDLTDSIGDLDLTGHGKYTIGKGGVKLNSAYLESELIPMGMNARSYEVWVKLDNLETHNAEIFGLVHDNQSQFDSLAFGKNTLGHWFPSPMDQPITPYASPSPEKDTENYIHLVMTMDKQGMVSLYRNGHLHGNPIHVRTRHFKTLQRRVMIGKMTTARGESPAMSGSIRKARLYNRALSPVEVLSAYFEDTPTPATSEVQPKMADLRTKLEEAHKKLSAMAPPKGVKQLQDEARKSHEAKFGKKLKDSTYRKVSLKDPRYGGIVRNAAVLTMTSAPTHTQPIARGIWLTEVFFNDPPPPPPNNVPALDERAGDKSLPIRERFSIHRNNPDCSACHARIDPLGFALENYDVVGRWRDNYPNKRKVDPSGILLKTHKFTNPIEFQQALVKEQDRFAKAFTTHVARFFAARELTATDRIAIEQIIAEQAIDDYQIKDLITAICLTPSLNR